jgi:hypothetical protein
VGDHYHYEYAEARHDHRGEYAGTGHEHGYHELAGVAEEYHRHYDLEREDTAAAPRITALEDEADVLRRDLSDARSRIYDLEAINEALSAVFRQLADGYVQVCSAGMASDAHVTIAEELAGAFHTLAGALGTGTEEPGPEDEPEEEPEPDPWDPGPEIDDEGGMSEYRYALPDDYERGQS